MNLIDRAKNILLTPKTEWEVIKGESTPQAQIITGYILPLAAISAVCGFLGSMFVLSFFGAGLILWAFVGMIIQVVMAVVSVFVVAFVIDALASNFGTSKNMAQAFKVAAYSFTAAWVGGIASIIPFIGWLVALIGALYGFYLLYLGLQQVMGAPEDKAVVYTIVVVVVTIVVMIIAQTLVTLATGAGMGMSRGLRGDVPAATAVAAAAKRSEANAKLDAFTKGIEAASKKMEAAQKSGDTNAQQAAAADVLAAALTGGKKVEPLSVEEVKAFVPDRFAGMPKTSSSAERSGVSSLMVTTAKASYGDGSKNVRLEVTDAGGAGAMMGFASWMGAMNQEREDDNGAERTKKEGSRIVHERMSKKGGENEYSVVVAERFVVKAVGTVDLATLKGGVSGVDLGKLESLKDSGVSKG